MPVMTEERIGVSATARMLGLSENRVRQLVAAGALPCERTPIGRLFRLGDVARLVTERERQAREQASRRV